MAKYTAKDLARAALFYRRAPRVPLQDEYIAELIATVREECAQVVDEHAEGLSATTESVCRIIAMRIRELGT